MTVNKWFDESLTRKPKPFEKINEDYYIQRRDVEELEAPNAFGTQKTFRCKARFITKEQYENMMNQLYTPSQNELIEKFGENNDDVGIIMMAIADLYEKVNELYYKS